MKFVLFIASTCCYLFSNAGNITTQQKNSNYFKRNFSGPVLPAKYGIQNDGSLISQTNLDAWLTDCKRLKSPVYFPAGRYLLPQNFEYDFGNADLSIIGDGPGKTVLTTNNGDSTNFAIPQKIDLTKQKPASDGIYQVDITAATVNRDFINVSTAALDSYLQIFLGVVKQISFADVKALGYITELDTRAADPGIDGLYVVAKHESHDYGGGFAQLMLNYPGAALYLQGTILERKKGIWSRYYSSVAFIAEGNFSVKNICFSNFRPYLFLPSSKKRQENLETRDLFIIENCKFENTARVLATMTYAGIMESANWYKASSYYSINWNMRFKKFIIKNSEFSYIHESIVWGAPPCSFYSISNNKVHDCYTMLNCFYLFPQYNSALPSFNKSRFSIVSNSFVRLRALNPGSENTVHLVRTLNTGIVSNNTFTDCTGIHLFLNGGTIVNGNSIKTFMSNVAVRQPRPPVILVKVAKNERISISNNKVFMGMMGNFVANESEASFVITNNKLIGPGVRYITTLTKDPDLDKYRVYTVSDLATFHRLAGIGHYDDDIKISNTVYYDQRNSSWESLAVQPFMYLYSEADNLNNSKQDINFSGNEIEASCLTRIQKKTNAIFNSVSFENNLIQYCSGLNVGNDKTIISAYILAGNTIKNGTLSMTSLGNVSTTIRSLNITGNTFFVDFTGSSSFTASHSLIFQKNTFIRNEAFNFGSAKAYKAFGLTTVPASVYQLSLTGYPGQQMIIKENKFIAEMTRGNVLSITNPDSVTITENSFALDLPSWQAEPIKARNAIIFNCTDTASSVDIEGNSYFPESGKENFLVSFDEAASVIKKLSTSDNSVPMNGSAITGTISAAKKSFINYFKGSNHYTDRETISSVKNKINKPSLSK